MSVYLKKLLYRLFRVKQYQPIAFGQYFMTERYDLVVAPGADALRVIHKDSSGFQSKLAEFELPKGWFIVKEVK